MTLKESFGLLGVACALFGGAYYLNMRPLYSGPINVPGVERVVVSPIYGASLQERHYYGTSTTVQFQDGTTATIRDFNGNFVMGGYDKVIGKIPPQTLTDILAETGRLARR